MQFLIVLDMTARAFNASDSFNANITSVLKLSIKKCLDISMNHASGTPCRWRSVDEYQFASGEHHDNARIASAIFNFSMFPCTGLEM